MLLEGRLHVCLHSDGAQVRAVTIRSFRRPEACRVLEGKSVETALRLVPQLFSLCCTAQGVAGRAALASVIPVTVADTAAQRRMLAAETALEHGTRILMDWPLWLGAAPDSTTARALRRALQPLRQGLSASDPALLPAVAQLFFHTVLGSSAATPEAFHALPQTDTLSAHLLATLYRDGLADYAPALPSQLLPAIPRPEETAWLAQRLAAEEALAFCAQPQTTNGAVPETGPLARLVHHPLISPYGCGIAARLLACLLECCAALNVLLTPDQAVEEPEILFDTAAAVAACLAPPPRLHASASLGLVDAARGTLAHHVTLTPDGLHIARYRILAPTEWNFHPRGPLVRGLLGDRVDDGLLHRARLLVLALDPCVACEVQLASVQEECS